MRSGGEPSERLRVYLDTSVFSAYADERTPERSLLTQEFWRRLPELAACTSTVARDELADTRDPDRRSALLALLEHVTIYDVTMQTRQLALEYVGAGVFAVEDIDDAMHVAAAVLMRQDALVSWNFRHLVNRRRRAMINEVNRTQGLAMIEIITPPEV